jgi:glycosyltransferase involved in cell wall biosynthesis
MADQITVVIQVYNEAKQILDCIKSAKLLTDKVVVMDMHSTDKTVDLTKKGGAEVVVIPYQSYVEPVRELAFTKSKTDWIFILDADERITPELVQEIRINLSKIQKPKSMITSITHYQLPRQNFFAGKKWFKHGGWWPDYQIRLIKKSALIRWPKEIHSTAQINGKKGTLKNPLQHFFHSSLSTMVEKTLRFEAIESELLFQAGRQVNWFTPLRKFCGELIRRLIIKAGFLDGVYGIIESFYQAYSKTLTWLFLYEKNYKKNKK